MNPSPHKNSLRNFPPDLLIVSGFPLILAILAISFLCYQSIEHPIAMTVMALLLALVGAGLLFWAKLPLYHAGIYFSFGPRAISKSRRSFYYWGMGLVALGCVAAALLIPLCGAK